MDRSDLVTMVNLLPTLAEKHRKILLISKDILQEGYTAEADILKMRDDVDGIRFLELTEQDLIQWQLSARQRKSILNCRNKVLAEDSHQTSKSGSDSTISNEPSQPKPVGSTSALRIAKELETKLRLGNSWDSRANFRQNQEIWRKILRPALAESQIEDLNIKRNAKECNLYIDMTQNSNQITNLQQFKIKQNKDNRMKTCNKFLHSLSKDNLNQMNIDQNLSSSSINSKERFGPDLRKNKLSSSIPYLLKDGDDNESTNNNDIYLIPDCDIDINESERTYSRSPPSLPILPQNLDVEIQWRETSLNQSHKANFNADVNNGNLMSSKPSVVVRPPSLPPKRKYVTSPNDEIEELREESSENIYELEPEVSATAPPSSCPQTYDNHRLRKFQPPRPIKNAPISKFNNDKLGKWRTPSETTQLSGSLNDHSQKNWHPPIPPRPIAIPNPRISKKSSATYTYEVEPSRSFIQQETRPILQGSDDHLKRHMDNIYELDPLDPNTIELTSVTHRHTDHWLANCTPTPRGPLHKPEGEAWNMSGLPKPPPFKNKLEPDQLAIIQDLGSETDDKITDNRFNPNDFRYYRNTDRRGAKQLLNRLPNLSDGAFLFRNSDDYSLALTIFFQGFVYNVGVQRNSDDGTFYCKTDTDKLVVTFKTLEEFVEYYKTHPLTVKKSGVHLKIYLRELLPDNVY